MKGCSSVKNVLIPPVVLSGSLAASTAPVDPSRAGIGDAGLQALPFSPRRVLVWLMVTTVALIVVSLVIQLLYNLKRWLDLDGEANIPAWYSSSLWLIAALLSSLIAVSKHRASAPFVAHWFGLCAVCVFFSMDEAAQIHEYIGLALDRQVFRRWAFLDVYQGWVFSWEYYGIAFVLVFLLVFRRFLRHLPPRILLLMITAGAIFLFGALGVETISAAAVNKKIDIPTPNLWTIILVAAEEFFEMAGVVLFIHSLLAYMRIDRLRIQLLLSD
jgi:hypothetical protein